MSRWLPVFQDLIRTRSVFGEEHAVVARVEEEIQRLGLSATRVPFDAAALAALPGAQLPFCEVPDRFNLVTIVPGTGGGRSIILNCHLDTVAEGDPDSWRGDPLSGDIEDGVIYGRGSYDDKAGAIICLSLMQRFSRRRLRGDVIVQFVLEDECTGNGSLLCLAHGPSADAAIIVDGTRGERGINEHAGNVRFTVSVFGKPASVSVSHMGVNAAEMLARLALEIKTAVTSLNLANVAPWTQFPSPNQCSLVGLACPEATLIVPAEASAAFYATFTPPHSLQTFRTLIDSVVRTFAETHALESPPRIDWRGFATEPVRSSARELEQALQRAARAELPFGPSSGTSDMRHFVDRGIPCVLFGPGRGWNPHRANECFELSSLFETRSIIIRAIEDWAG